MLTIRKKDGTLIKIPNNFTRKKILQNSLLELNNGKELSTLEIYRMRNPEIDPDSLPF